MTAALVRNHTANNFTSSATTIAATVVTAGVAVGNVLVVWVGFDNLTTTTPTASLSLMSGETASWTKLASVNSGDPTPGNGVRGELWAIKTTVAWTVGTAVTATLSGAVRCATILMSEFSGVTTTVQGTPGSSYDAPASTTPTDVGALVIGAGVLEYGVPINANTDTTNGSWSAGYSTMADLGTITASVAAIMQSKVVTAGGTQTYVNPLAQDYGIVVVALLVNVAPNAPTLNSPATGTTVDRAGTQRLGWVFSDPNTGDTQSKFDLQYKLSGGAWVPITGTTPNNFVDITGGTFAAGSYEWQARTYDAMGIVGPWSASSFFTAADMPGVPSITAPVSGSTVGLATATVTWSVAAQTDYQVRKCADLAGAPDTSTIYYDTGDVVDSVTRSVVLTFPVNGRWDHIQVRVKAAGLWSTWADCRVLVSYTAPMVPTLTATPNSATASIAVTITNPTPTGGQPPVTYNDVYISSPLDPEYRAATMVPAGGTWVWWTPAAARTYTIRVVAFGSNGTAATSV
jgi:hypothetical protein